MRKKVFIALLTCSLLAVVVSATAYAQEPGQPVRATIPFDFSLRGKTLPAGKYEIRRISDEPDGLMIVGINRDNRSERVMFETEAVQARKIPRRGELVFNRYGDSYFLSEIFVSGEQEGRELHASRQERNLERETASNKTEPETVEVALY